MKTVASRSVESQTVPTMQRLIMWLLLFAVAAFAFYQWMQVVEARRPLVLSGIELMGAVGLYVLTGVAGIRSFLGAIREGFSISWLTLFQMFSFAALAVWGWWLASVGVI